MLDYNFSVSISHALQAADSVSDVVGFGNGQTEGGTAIGLSVIANFHPIPEDVGPSCPCASQDARRRLWISSVSSQRA